MQRFEWALLSPEARAKALARPERRRDPQVVETVRRIFEEVEREGAKAVERWSIAFDRCAPARIELTGAVADAARASLAKEDVAAIEFAVSNVRQFHEATKPRSSLVEMCPGLRCRQVWQPIGACGLYVPGGTAPLFSTLIMLAEPARVAAVRQRIVVTPPNEGKPHPAMVAAAVACGVEEIWLIGGAQAIAALTFGAGVAKASKIFGPGNAYVAEAKRLAASLPGGPAIDVPAGPSELMVIADGRANAALVATDLLSQAEHDCDAQVVLVAASTELIAAVEAELERQVRSLPRAGIACAALAQARVIHVRDMDEAAEVANSYAPEHLSLQAADPHLLLERVESAGTVFLGGFSAEAFGDYVCGPSHVLPTDGAARAWGGVSVASFMKSFAVQEIDETGARALVPATARLARLEGLEAHARAAEARLP